jgi:uncharacterized protein (DUF2062 family)
MKKKTRNKILRSFKRLYLKLVRINDSPQKIALGFGSGVFLGILPGTGPIAALILAALLRINKAAALLGSLLTNTWLSLVTFLLSIRVGSAILNVDSQKVYQDWKLFLRDFHWINLFKLSVLKIILPVLCGYLIVGFFAGLLVYVVTLIILKIIKKKKRNAD